MASQSPEARIKIIAENLARAALQEAGRDVKAVGAAAGGTVGPFDKLVRSFTTGTASSNAFSNAVRTLSFQAAGIPGPVGKAASAIGAMGLGSGPVLGATAAVGALALGYRILTRDAREASDAADKLTESLKRQTLGVQLRDLQAKQGDASAAALRSAGTAQDTLGGFNPFLHLVASIRESRAEEAGEKAVAAALAIRDIRADDHLKTIRALELESDLFGQSAVAAARIRAEAQGFTDAETERLVVATRNLETKKAEARALEQQNRFLEEQHELLTQIGADVAAFFAGPEGFPTFAQEIIAGIKVPTLADLLAQEGSRQAGIDVTALEKQGGEFAFQNFDAAFFSNVQAGVDDALATTPGFKTGGMLMAHAFVTAVGQFAGGGAGGAFGGIGSLLTGASGLQGAPAFLGPAGFAFSAIGSLVSVFDRGADRRHRELMDETRRIRQNTEERGRPQNVSTHFYLNGRELSGAIIDDVIYESGRAARRHGQPVLPPR